MSDVLSPLLQFVLQETGANEDEWGDILNSVLLEAEQAIAGTTTKVVTNATYTLTDEEARSAILELSGTLTDNVIVEVPARSKTYFVRNATSQGSFTVSLKVASFPTLTQLAKNGNQLFVCSGVTLSSPTTGGGIPIGSVLHFGSSVCPANYLICNGAAVSRVTYADLFAAIGTTWGTGDGSTTFNLPDAADRYMRGGGGSSAVGAFLAQDIQSHTHTGSFTIADHVHSVGVTLSTDGAHAHTFTGPIPSVGGPGGAAGFFFNSGTFNTDTSGPHTHTATVSETPAGGGSVSGTVSATGGTETRPNSIVLLPIIRYA